MTVDEQGAPVRTRPLAPVPRFLAVPGTVVLVGYTVMCALMLVSFTREAVKGDGESLFTIVGAVLAVVVAGIVSALLLFSIPRMFWAWVMFALCVGGTATFTGGMLAGHGGLDDAEGWVLLVTLTAVQVGGFTVPGFALLAMWSPRTLDALAQIGGRKIR
ncbi:hypothetical protein OG689_43080 [Kitasatospora sp. NBC_00240]|uniref:hypothetical protein n=1 Tax=Kitasatospora sp. NBC_00240 TaxID=2903567 RepID=UPI00224DEE94|nr:hypothetical protein [Kitasatospora sp. NBC_00240]MCX5215928.1 hypothetical protein [Kitasatospora sp. NBC_00240]